MTKKNILVLGIGNLLRGDEGLGIHVINQLRKIALPPDVELLDGGTSGFELLRYLHDRKKVIFVDAINGDADPGTILKLTPDDIDSRWQPASSAHQFNLQELLHFARELMPRPEIIIFGIVPKITNQFSTWITGTVQQQIPRLIMEITNEITQEKYVNH